MAVALMSVSCGSMRLRAHSAIPGGWLHSTSAECVSLDADADADGITVCLQVAAQT